MPQPRAN